MLAVEPYGSRQRRRFAQAVLRRLHVHAEQATAAGQQRGEADAALQKVEEIHVAKATPDLFGDPSQLALAAVVAVTLAFDVVFLGPTVEHFARLSLRGAPVLVDAARLVIPGMLLILELAVASMLVNAWERIDDGGVAVYVVRLLQAVVVTGIVPLMVVATLFAERPETLLPAQEGAFDAQLVGLVLFSALAHGAVVFSGQRGNAMKVNALFVAHHSWLRGVVGRQAWVRARAVASVRDSWLRYVQLRSAQATEFPDWPIEAGPFFANVRSILRELAGGRDVIVESDAPSAPPTPAPTVPVTTTEVAPPTAEQGPQPDVAAEDDRDVRDADSEVKP
jgi:hypothetical protein